MSVQIVPYDAAWPVQFQQIKQELEQALEETPVIAIEHVGSTSVPGLVAKPILDIDIVVERDDVEHCIRALEEAAGYTCAGDRGISDRYAMQRVGNHSEPARHVYVCVRDCLALRNHLAVRDFCCRSSDARERYGQLKSELARRFPNDIDSYVAAKSALLQELLIEAGISKAEAGEIFAANQQTTNSMRSRDHVR